MTQPFLKSLLAILLLFCLFQMPYSYYEAVRFFAMLGFVLLAYYNYYKTVNATVFIYLALALLFQPFAKISFGRTVWNALDIIVAIGLIISLFSKKK